MAKRAIMNQESKKKTGAAPDKKSGLNIYARDTFYSWIAGLDWGKILAIALATCAAGGVVGIGWSCVSAASHYRKALREYFKADIEERRQLEQMLQDYENSRSSR